MTQVLETVALIAQLGGAREQSDRVRALRAEFEAKTGAFAPDDPWFEERSRAFWTDAATRGRFGRVVAEKLTPEQRSWLGPLERAHRGLFLCSEQRILVDTWSGAEIAIADTFLDDESRAELETAAGQLFDARIVGTAEPFALTLLPGAVFHPRHATAAIEQVVKAARAQGLATHDALDALLRMERSLRALSRVKAAYAYRVDALSQGPSHGAAQHALRRQPKTVP